MMQDPTKQCPRPKFQHLGQSVEMSPLYVLLASQESSYVTGEVFGATGGLEIS
jgi:NAD(P)-dependent dehydrogenase (short-subunit alcohol dehydrogenase family)